MERREITRRLAAIVAADVAGYSRLTSRDEEAIVSALRAHRRELVDAKIVEYGGRIANTAGDSLLVEFPSVVDALRCSLDIQRGMAGRNAGIDDDARIEFRIGINLGDVIQEDGDLLGDGVNVAARLEGLAEPGGICLSRAARDQVRDRMDVAFEDLGEVKVKHIERPVRVFRVAGAQGREKRPPPSPARTATGRRLVALAAAAIALAGLGTAASIHLTDQGSPLFGSASAARASIAVLPFANLSDDPEQDYFSDGFTTDLITELSKFRDLFVISSNTAFTYRDGPASVREVGGDLGVRYALEGSIRRLGDRIRINVQLTDTETGQSLWAERYDEPVDNLFDLQDQITLQIVRTLAVRLTRLEQDRALATSTRNLEAYDYVLRGLHLQRRSTRADNIEARQMFERAIELDPDYAHALVGLGDTQVEDVLFGWSEMPQQALARAHELALGALSIDQDFDRAHGLLASVHLIRRQYEQALVESERAIALNPNDPDNYADQGATLVWSGHPEGAVRALETAHRFDPMMGARPLTHLGVAYYLTGRYDEAVAALERAIGINPEFAYGHTILAATHGMRGDREPGLRAAAAVLRLDPFFSTETFGRLFRDPGHAERLVEGLRKAGLD